MGQKTIWTVSYVFQCAKISEMSLQQKRGCIKEIDKAAMRDFEAMVKFCEQEG